MTVEVVEVRCVSGDGNLKAFADIRIDDYRIVNDALVVKGFCIMKGKSGVFVSMPRKCSQDGRWFDILEPSDALRRSIETAVLEAYGRERPNEVLHSSTAGSPLTEAIEKAAERMKQ